MASGSSMVQLESGVEKCALVGPGEREHFPSKLPASSETPQGLRKIIFQRVPYKARRAFKFQVL
jgi:hypothetical protein